MGHAALSDVEWVASTMLRATVPWGMDPGVYTLTVGNPGGEWGDLAYVGSNWDGVQKTADGGTTWQVVNEGLTAVSPDRLVSVPGQPYSDCSGVFPDVVAAHPAQPGLLLAGVNHNYQGGSVFYSLGTIYRSTDHGEHWARVTVSQQISVVYGVAFDTLSPTVAYAATGGDAGQEGSGVFRSTDGGQTWTRVGAGEPALDCVECLAVEPDGGHRVFAQACGEGLYVSFDHGVSWTAAIPWSHGSWVNDMLCADYDPPVLYAATGSGLYRMGEGGGGCGGNRRLACWARSPSTPWPR